jgi:hypothetical protein
MEELEEELEVEEMEEMEEEMEMEEEEEDREQVNLFRVCRSGSYRKSVVTHHCM